MKAGRLMRMVVPGGASKSSTDASQGSRGGGESVRQHGLVKPTD
jgi:hypothetical protein